MRKVYNFLGITILITFFVFLGCTYWLQTYGYNHNIFKVVIFCALYCLFIGVARISLEIDLINTKSKNKKG